jgi:hypothetical protein
MATIIGPSAAVAVAVWLAIDRWFPAPGIEVAHVSARLSFAFHWIAFATLFCLVAGIESVAHRRLFNASYNPLAGAESEAHRVDLRYLQQTLEQLVVFAVGLVGLAWLARDARGLNAVAATACVWILARFAFWIGYHRGPRFRSIGAPGMAQSMIVLIYVCARFANQDFGTAGYALVLGGFAVLEAVLFALALRDRG